MSIVQAIFEALDQFVQNTEAYIEEVDTPDQKHVNSLEAAKVVLNRMTAAHVKIIEEG